MTPRRLPVAGPRSRTRLNRCRRMALGGLAVTALLIAGASPASAHPLGNFTVNHYDGLRLSPQRVDDSAVIDTAEIPTLQERAVVDADGDGTVSDTERQAYAATTCSALASAIRAVADGETLRWTVHSSDFGYRPGSAGLKISRLECQLTAPAQLGRATKLDFRNSFQSDRIGWREITAIGDGVHLVRSPVPAASVSDELRKYPNDLLSSPLQIRSAVLDVRPGSAGGTAGTAIDLPVAGPVARWLNVLSTHFNELAGARTLTPAVGLLAVLLSVVLGASHAAMPGHGKTVIAAYLAGKRGSVRDALTVGATVTITHTAGVIALGLLLSGVATLAGETVLAWLGVVSGLMIAGIGAWLLRAAISRYRAHRHSRVDPLVLDLDASRTLTLPDTSAAALVVSPAGSSSAAPVVSALVDVGAAPDVVSARLTGHGHGHGHGHGEEAGHSSEAAPSHGHGHGHGRGHGHGHGHGHGFGARPPATDQGPLGRMALVGMGVAGGLVPSPSALVVLLGAIGLGRTSFGILLVLGYGIGMAGMLTAVGLLLVRLRDRMDRGAFARLSSGGERMLTITPILTATLVLLVGAGLCIRALVPLA